MNIFDIIGPTMVGPSSSHTAGAVKIGLMARQLFGRQPQNAEITLYGSFAQTGRGHGTDKALVAGLLGFKFDDPRIKDSISLADERGIQVSFKIGELKDAHPNTALIRLWDHDENFSISGSSIGGGSILITKINDMDVEFSGELYTIVIMHKDTPGAVASVTGLLAQDCINIASMKMYRSHRGGDAIMIIETDQEICGELQIKINVLTMVFKTTIAKPV